MANHTTNRLWLPQSSENQSLYFFLSENASVKYFPNTAESVLFIRFFAFPRVFKSYLGLYRLKKVHSVKKCSSVSTVFKGHR